MLFFICGLIAGKLILDIFTGLGFGVFLENFPLINTSLKILSAVYLIFLAAKSWNLKLDLQLKTTKKHYTFYHGIIIHTPNLKAWAMCLMAWRAFAPQLGGAFHQFVSICSLFALSQLILHSFLCWLGSKIRLTRINNNNLPKSLILLTVLVVLWALILPSNI